MGQYRLQSGSSVARRRAVPIAALPQLRGVPHASRGPHATYVRQCANPAACFVRPPEFDGFGFSLGKVVKNIGKTVTKAVKDTGHVVGKVVTSKVGQAVIGTGLALTGVGIPAAAAIGAATQAGGQLIKPGGNLGKAAKGAAVGAAEGVAAGIIAKPLGKIGIVETLREKIGTAQAPKTYESDSRLDALAEGKIPDVSVVPSSVPLPVLKGPVSAPDVFTASDAADAAVDMAKRKGAEVLREGVEKATTMERQAGEATRRANSAKSKSEADSWRRKAQKFLDGAKKAKAAAEAAATVASTTTPPSANPVAPQGGYPVSTSSTVVPSGATTVTVGGGGAQEAGVGSGIGDLLSNPVVLIAGAAALYLATSKRR